MRWWWCLFGIACGNQQASPPAPRCEPTIEKVAGRLGADAKRTAARELHTRIDTAVSRIESAMVAACVADGWNADALRCLGGATLDVDITTCTGKLVHEHYDRVQRRLAPLREELSSLVTPDAHVLDASSIDAGVADGSGGDASTDGAATPDARVHVAKPSAPTFDCRQKVVDAHDLACIRTYCTHHQIEPRCNIE